MLCEYGPWSHSIDQSKCVVGRRINATPGQQQMADLPLDRVSPDEPPFTNVGIVYFGPFGGKRVRSVMKRYGVCSRFNEWAETELAFDQPVRFCYVPGRTQVCVCCVFLPVFVLPPPFLCSQVINLN